MIYLYQDRLISLITPFIRLANRFSPKFRYRMITLCFLVDLVLFCIVRYLLHKDSYFYNTVLGIFLMFAIAFFSLDKPLVRIHWRRSIWLAWFGLCIAFTVSDLFVPKKACGLGIILAFVFTGVFFVWQNHTRQDLLWKCFKDAVKWAFLIMAAIAFLCRPYIAGGRYAGIFTNPNMFGLYLYVIFAVYMSDFDWSIQSNRPIRKSLLMYAQMALTVFFIAVSQARTAAMAAVAIFTVWIVCRFIVNYKQKVYRAFLKSIGMFFLSTVILYPVYYFGITHIPNLVGHPIVFQDDVLYMSNGEKIEDIGDWILKEMPGENIMIDEERWDNGMLKSSVLSRIFGNMDSMNALNRLSSGRITIYEAYVRNLNYLGHKNISIIINDKKVAHAHNNWIQFGYTYGLFSLFFYGIITILSVLFSLKLYLREYRKKGSYCFLPLAVSVGFVVATLTECLFLPFELFPAFAFWFVFSDLFVKKVPENRLREQVDETKVPLVEG